jgi:hypothetical protein
LKERFVRISPDTVASILNNSNLVAVVDDMGWKNGPNFYLLASEKRRIHSTSLLVKLP